MADFKGVEVFGPRGTDFNFRLGTHEDGTQIMISDGHLIVRDSSSSIIAIYAPGKWSRSNIVGL